MIDITLDKSSFFDRPKVIAAVDRATRQVLSKFGAFVRRSARSSIRPRKRITSPPGQPPFSHTGLLRNRIFFGYDPTQSSVVIGPTPLNARSEAPALLEYGGTTTLPRKGRHVRARFRGRPYMGPAFQKETPKLPAMWADSVK